MGYEINVALNGRHLFATHERSLKYDEDLKRCLEIFLEKFPESEGYKISVEYIEHYGRNIDIDKFMKESLS